MTSVDGEPEIIAKVEQGMRRMGELEAHIPAIRDLLSVDPGDPAFAALEGTVRRRHLFAALRALSLCGAQRRPLVLVIEDLHWIDLSSEEFLTFLLDAVAGVSLLLLVTYRIGYTPPFGSRSFATTLTLHSFSETETLAMASQVLGTAQFPPALQTALMDKAEGVPLFIEEVTKTLLDLGVLQREDGGYRLVKSLGEVRVPDTMQGIIMARLDRLGDEGKRTVQMASVIGRQFLVRLLARIAGLSDRLEGLLHELQALEIIYEQGFVPEPAYIFKHAVIQDVAYQSLLMQRRKALHQAVGEAIEALYQDRLEDHYAELVHHLPRVRCGTRRWPIAARPEKRPWRSRPIARPWAPSSRRSAPSGICQRSTTRARRPSTSGSPCAPRSGRRATSGVSWPICARRRPSPRPSTTRGGWARSLACWPSISASWARMTRPSPPPSAPSRWPRPAGTSSCTRWRTSDLGLAYQAQGAYQQAIDALGQTIASLEGPRRHELFGRVILPAVISRAYLASCHAEVGTFAAGRTLGDEGLQIAEAVDHPASVMIGCWGIGLLWLHQGDLPRALPLLERAVGLCREIDLPLYFPRIAVPLGAAYTLGGRSAEAVSLLTQALEQTMATAMVVYQALCRLTLGEAQLRAGGLEEAYAHAERALAQAREYHERDNQAYARRLLGAIAARREPPESAQAQAHYRQALTLADELGMRPLQAHCHRGLGTLYATTGQREQARTALSTAIEMYRVWR